MVGVGLVVAVFGGSTYMSYEFLVKPTPVSAAPAPVLQVVAPVPAVATVPPQQRMASEKQKYEADRDALRKAKPKTEPQVLKVLNRKADQCLAAGEVEYCHWFYETKEVGRDIIAVTLQGEKVVNIIY